MARLFHLACMGPLAPDFDRRTLAPKIAALLGDSATARQAMDASPSTPIPIAIAKPTLAAARTLDQALLKLGIMSVVCYVDASLPKTNRIYIDQRQGPRRSDAKTGVDASAAPKVVKVRSADDLRATRGRRDQDKR